MAPRTRPRARTPVSIGAALAIAALSLAGCDHRSSPQPGPSGSAGARPSSSGESADELTYSKISAATATKLQRRLTGLAGVFDVTYYSDTHTLDVNLTGDATAADRDEIDSIVTGLTHH